MDMNTFLLAMDSILKNVGSMDPKEVLEHFPHIHKIFVRMTSLLMEMEMLENAVKFQEQFLQLCEQYHIAEVHPDIYSYALNEIGESYYNLKKSLLAKKFYEQNIKFNEGIKRRGLETVSTLLDLQLAYGKLALIHAGTGTSGKRSEQAVTTTKLLQLQQSMVNQICERSNSKPSKKIIATVSMVNTFLELAHMNVEDGKMEEGLEFFDRARDVAKRFEKLDDELLQSTDSEEEGEIPSLKDTLDSIELGRTSYLARMGRLEEAYTEVTKILDRQHSRLNEDSPVLISTYNNLGHILASLKRYPESEEYLWKAIKLVLKNTSAEFVELYGERLYQLQSLLSNVLKIQNKINEASEVLDANARLSTQVYGDYSLQAVETRYYLSTLYLDRQQTKHACELLKDAYTRGRSGSLKATNPIFLPLVRSLTTLLLSEANSDIFSSNNTPLSSNEKPQHANIAEADRIILEAQNAIDAAYGPRSRQSGLCSLVLGQVYEESGHNTHQATAMFRRALNAYQTLPDSPSRDASIISAQIALSKSLLKERKFSDAKYLLDDALSSSRSLSQSAIKKLKSLSNDPQDIAHKEQLLKHILLALNVYSATSHWYFQTGQSNKAIITIGDGLSLGYSTLGPDHPQTVNLTLELATLLASTGDFKAANARLSKLRETISKSSLLSKIQKSSMKAKIKAQLEEIQVASELDSQRADANNSSKSQRSIKKM